MNSAFAIPALNIAHNKGSSDHDIRSQPHIGPGLALCKSTIRCWEEKLKHVGNKPLFIVPCAALLT